MIVGIDVAKGKNCAFYGTGTGKSLLKRMMFENSVEGFVHRVALNGRGGIAQQERLKAVWKKAIDSIGCKAGESLEVEAKLMV